MVVGGGLHEVIFENHNIYCDEDSMDCKQTGIRSVRDYPLCYEGSVITLYVACQVGIHICTGMMAICKIVEGGRTRYFGLLPSC